MNCVTNITSPNNVVITEGTNCCSDSCVISDDGQLIFYLPDPKPIEKPTSEAEKRAECLLLSCLNRRQKEMYLAHKRFLVCQRGLIYRIRYNQKVHINIDVFMLRVEDSPAYSICMHLRPECINDISIQAFPVCDHLLAQKLVIEQDGELLKKACIHEVQCNDPLERQYL